MTWDKICGVRLARYMREEQELIVITETEKQIVEDAEAKLLGLAARMLPAYSYSAAWDCTY